MMVMVVVCAKFMTFCLILADRVSELEEQNQKLKSHPVFERELKEV